MGNFVYQKSVKEPPERLPWVSEERDHLAAWHESTKEGEMDRNNVPKSHKTLHICPQKTKKGDFLSLSASKICQRPGEYFRHLNYTKANTGVDYSYSYAPKWVQQMLRNVHKCSELWQWLFQGTKLSAEFYIMNAKRGEFLDIIKREVGNAIKKAGKYGQEYFIQ